MIQCDNTLCVFCSDDRVCLKENIKLNPMGVCKSLIRIDISDETLKQIKPGLRKEAEKLEMPNEMLSDYETLMKYMQKREKVKKKK